MLKYKYVYQQGNKSLRVYKEEKLVAFCYQSGRGYRESEMLLPLTAGEIEEFEKMIKFFGMTLVTK